MEKLPIIVVIIPIAIGIALFFYAARLLYNKYYDYRPVVCDGCGKLVLRNNSLRCPDCGHKVFEQN